MSETAPAEFDAKHFVANLPHQPGVYRMLNGAGEVLYVGKANDLKKRVASYFQQANLSPRIRLMVSHIAAIDTTATRSEAEALLLENNLIKSLAPRYNILFRDDKSYPYIVLTQHAAPRLAFYRGSPDKRHRYFGPFPNSHAVRESIQLLQKVFRIRTCEDSVFGNRSRPCLLYQIKRCSAPCVGLIAADTYREDVKNTLLFLQGKQTEVLAELTEKMARAAAQMDYEHAAILRDQIQALRVVQEKQFVESSNTLDVDIIAAVGSSGQGGVGESVCVNLAMVRGGRHLGDRAFFPKNAEGCDLPQVIEAFVAQHYLGGGVPALIVVGEKLHGEAQAAMEALLSTQSGHKVNILANPIGERRKWLEMALANAKLALGQRLSQHVRQEEGLLALQNALDFPGMTTRGLTRIECFDISHTQGEATIAACVVYDQLAMRNGEYRRYNIPVLSKVEGPVLSADEGKGITPGDDYAAIRQAVTLRYQKLAQIDEGGDAVSGKSPDLILIKSPDLILIDGGKGQVSAAQSALAELGLNDLLLLGVAKGEGRKPGLEQLIFADGRKPLQLDSAHPGLHLIQQIRDEAHRFAIAGHRAKRAKTRTQSSLEEIDGIGAKRRQSLLARFGGLKGVRAANVDELQQAPGISRALAEKIYKALR